MAFDAVDKFCFFFLNLVKFKDISYSDLREFYTQYSFFNNFYGVFGLIKQN